MDSGPGRLDSRGRLGSAAAVENLLQQANPGHGIRPPDPNSAAQVRLEPKDAERKAKSVSMGEGMVAGVTSGIAIEVVATGTAGVLGGAGKQFLKMPNRPDARRTLRATEKSSAGKIRLYAIAQTELC